MGTRAQVYIYDGEQETPFVCIYGQSDGYPAGLGRTLTEFCMGIGIVNGMGGNQPLRIANGAGCFAAQLIAHLKEKPGGIYIERADTPRENASYCYEIRVPSTFTVNDGSQRATIRALAYDGRQVPSDRDEPEPEAEVSP